MIDLQTEIYSAMYDLAMLILNPTYTPGPDPENPAIPAIPIIMDEQAHAAPALGPYIAIQGSPALTPIGTVDLPDIVADDETAVQDYVQPYECSCELWEVNSNGKLLTALRNGAETEAALALMALTNVGTMEFGNVEPIPLKIESRWIAQNRMVVRLTIAAKTQEAQSIIETVEVTRL